jgi:DNA-directed RNA polymerase specialized sigma24 family protein
MESRPLTSLRKKFARRGEEFFARQTARCVSVTVPAIRRLRTPRERAARRNAASENRSRTRNGFRNPNRSIQPMPNDDSPDNWPPDLLDVYFKHRDAQIRARLAEYSCATLKADGGVERLIAHLKAEMRRSDAEWKSYAQIQARFDWYALEWYYTQPEGADGKMRYAQLLLYEQNEENRLQGAIARRMPAFTPDDHEQVLENLRMRIFITSLKWDPSIGNAAQWVFTLLRHCVADAFRERQTGRRGTRADVDSEDVAAPPGANVSDQNGTGHRELADILAEIPTKQRRVLEYFGIGSEPWSLIAATLGGYEKDSDPANACQADYCRGKAFSKLVVRFNRFVAKYPGKVESAIGRMHPRLRAIAEKLLVCAAHDHGANASVMTDKELTDRLRIREHLVAMIEYDDACCRYGERAMRLAARLLGPDAAILLDLPERQNSRGWRALCKSKRLAVSSLEAWWRFIHWGCSRRRAGLLNEFADTLREIVASLWFGEESLEEICKRERKDPEAVVKALDAAQRALPLPPTQFQRMIPL